MSISSEPRLNAAGNYVLGVGADLVSVVATQPLDTNATYAMNRTARPPLGMWLLRGMGANCKGAFVQGGVPFAVNGIISRHLFKNQELSQGQLVAKGGFTGMIAAAAIAPFERVAKLQQLHGGSLTAACRRSIEENGVRSFFKGVGAIAGRDAIVFGVFFGARQAVENRLEPYIPNRELRVITASALTGGIAGVLSNPFARANVLMLGDTKGEYLTCAGTIAQMVRQGGVKSLFIGVVPRACFMAGYYVTLSVGAGHLEPRMPAIFYEKEGASKTGS